MPGILRKVFSQIYYVLKPGGVLLSISIKNPDFWINTVHEYAISENWFESNSYLHGGAIFNIEGNKLDMNYYFYYLKKPN